MKNFNLIFLAFLGASIECLVHDEKRENQSVISIDERFRRPFANPIFVAAGGYAMYKARHLFDKLRIIGNYLSLVLLNVIQHHLISLFYLARNFYKVNHGIKCDFFGNDLKSTRRANFADCEKKCELTSECTHFTWNLLTSICWMKEGRVFPSDAVYTENSMCGMRRDLWILYKKRWDKMPMPG
jgi:hypothetical protein